MAALHYDEFAYFHENAAEAGLAFDGPPAVERLSFEAPSGNHLSALAWGEADPELVLLHGGGQNAHTWDTVALALGRPLLAIDLPGHGHSDWRSDRAYIPQQMAEDVAALIDDAAAGADALVGMSLGGLTALIVAAEQPALIDRLALIDVTPGVNKSKAKAIIDFIAGPEDFESFDELLERTVAFNPTRSESSLRRGILHNAREREDGRWVWRYDLPIGERMDLEHRFSDLWDAVDAIECPVMLCRGDRSPVVADEDVDEFQRRRPELRYELVADAGHSIQGDQPLVLANLITGFLAT